MKLVYQPMAHWPCLSWLAKCTPQEAAVQVFHGSQVEIKDPWFCEAAWAGDFEAGDFDRTDIVAGSGGRIRDNGLCFVSSGSDVDRLHSIEKDGVTLVSNSLIGLLAWIEGDADIDYGEYGADFANYRYTVFGQRTLAFPSTAGEIDLTYFSNLVWNGNRLEVHDKPCANRHFNDFDDYRVFLQRSMQVFVNNAQNDARSLPYKLSCPLSNGYDSPTIAALLREFEGVEAFTFDVDQQGADDSGEPVAVALGIPCHVIDRDAWCLEELAEIPFIACSGSIGDLAFKAAESHMRGAVLMNGYGGDLLWDKQPTLSDPIAIGGGSMLGMTEYRLWAGFLNCPVGVWGIRQLHDIIRISNSAEMKPWDVDGNYSRPICRRIVETAGVGRSLFGISKHGVSVVPLARRNDLGPVSRMDLLAWLSEQRTQGRTGKRSIPHPRFARMLDWGITPLVESVGKAERIARRRRFKWMVPAVKALKETITRPYYHHRYRVHWAIDRAKRRYQEPE
ncbi:MAG TPA: hypothetical protein ENI68_08080 [Gammaproteobacteria bacterium]|nr:hypothetical protein [Gammaproteobacteria bacterium]